MQIAELPWAAGIAGICPMPGRQGDYTGDMARLLGWQPSLVVTLAATGELAAKGAADLPQDLAAAGIAWAHLPIPDFGTPPRAMRAQWPGIARGLLRAPRLLVHCMGGCGRSGMILLRLMIEQGEDPDSALARLRAVRPCAVETKAQLRWATGP
jgi:protein-tyrosine phosphatase